MKKIIALTTIMALSITSLAEAKGVRSTRSVSGKPIVAQKTQNVSSNTQKDATFNNTPNAQVQTPQANRGSTLTNFATGAAAGYVLSEMLSPNQAQANQPQQTAEPMAQQAVENTQNVANVTVAQFRSIGGQIDPYLIEKTDGYRRYCIAGVQYLAPAQGGQTTPVVMVNPNGTPLACQLIP